MKNGPTDARFVLFLSILARDNPIDGGGSCIALAATDLSSARTEALDIIEKRAPADGCDFECDFAAIVEASHYETVRQLY